MSVGIGPQIGFITPMKNGYQGYLNLRGYRDLEVEDRPKSWTGWVTLQNSRAAPEPAVKPVVQKY